MTETTTISYSYDPLYRVTGASYSGGLTNSYGYAYDAVGNRTVQTQTITSTLVTNYTYDNANRLTGVNGVTYSWDDNGNLLSDGAKSYGYDQANRLKQVTQGAITTTLAYNGVGDRLQQTIGLTTTRYVLDPAAGLTQVLADGTNTYLYGNARLAQYQASMQYFGADGLGSVRQLYDAGGQVLANNRYDPYGGTMSHSGEATSVFAFAGEQQDAGTGLEYLRARYYSGAQGRFVQPDSLVPDMYNPQSLNRYSYTLNNPVRYTDPTGHCPGILCIPGFRIGFEIGFRIGGGDQARRDQVGGKLVIDLSQTIQAESASRGVDADGVSAILRHESGAFERRLLTPSWNYETGSQADWAEQAEALVRGDRASSGPGQMQLRTERELEERGYVAAQPDGQARVNALLDPKAAVGYIAGEIQYLDDQLQNIPGFGDLSPQDRQRIELIGYNQGWDNLETNIELRSFRTVIDRSDYDNLTLDEYERWRDQ